MRLAWEGLVSGSSRRLAFEYTPESASPSAVRFQPPTRERERRREKLVCVRERERK